MNCTSLRTRLLATWAIFIAITLLIAGLGLRALFERSIVERTTKELAADLRQLTRGLDISADNKISVVRAPTDPQFDIVTGGRYWQIDENNAAILKSPSLDAATLQLPAGFVPEEALQKLRIAGPNDQDLFAIVQTLNHKPHPLTFITAVDAAEIDEDTNQFSMDMFSALAVLALWLLGGAYLHVTTGLRPLEALRSSVTSIRTGTARNLPETFPDEVMPLVTEANALLKDSDNALRKARERAGNLAHGLNTPLTVMTAKARALRQRGEGETANEIDRQIGAMRRHVDRELARARARGSLRGGDAPVDAVKAICTLSDAIASLPRDTEVSWTLDLPDSLLLAVDPDDFNDIAGNLIENAYKWSHSQIRIGAKRSDNRIDISVGDDGPGVAEDQYDRVLLRGERADTTVDGSGLGLAIVNDLVDMYSGKLRLARSPLGGLEATVSLPARD